MTHPALIHLAKHDKILAGLIDRYDVSIPEAHINYFEELVSSVISQQLSVKAAQTIEKRFKDLFGDNFPNPQQILEKDVAEIRGAGLSRPKIGYIQDLAVKVLDGTVAFDDLDSLTNREIITELINVKGIGQWTAHMFLIFSLGRMDVLPTGDLGIRSGIKKLYGFDNLPTPDEIETLAQANSWAPFESVASLYVWKSLDND